MILICSAGHEWNPERNLWHRGKRKGKKCGALLTYSVIGGSTYCQRRLKLKPLTLRVGESENE